MTSPKEASNKCSSNTGGQTPLMLASSSGNLELVRLFLRNSAEVNMTDVNGRTALFYAAFYGHVSICKELLSKGASVDIQDIKGATPMPEAVKPDKVQILQLLLEHKANFVDYAGKSAQEKVLDEILEF